MQKYDSYKESGVQWIGEIPNHWEIARLKSYCSLKGRIGWNGLRSDEFKSESYAYLVTGQDFNSSNIEWDKCYQIDKERYDEDPFIQLSNGDLLITKDGTIGKIAKVSNLDKPACLNSGIFVMKQKQPVFNQGFLYWSLCSKMLKDFNSYTSSGTTILHLYQNVFEKMPLVIPSMEEQTAISNYLDNKCAKIDNVIATQEKRVELLRELKQSIITRAVTRGINPDTKMKDSGVEWIGEIPSHWEVIRLKLLCRSPLMYGANESAEEYREDLPRYIRITDIDENGHLREEVRKSLSVNKAKDYILKKGDLLFARSGATVGKTYLFDEDYVACFAGYLIKAELNSKTCVSEYVLRYTQSSLYENWKNSIFIQSTIQNIGADKYNELLLTLPPISEQQQIITYIKLQIDKLDNSINKALHQIELLKEYKQSLITEVVTGKCKVF